MTNTPTLRSIVERVNQLEDQKQLWSDDIKEIYAEAKSNGFNVKAIRKIVRDMRRPPDAEVEALVETYRHALGQLDGTPLGASAVERDLPPPAKLAAPDTSDRPFYSWDTDEPRVAEPGIPPFLQRA